MATVVAGLSMSLDGFIAHRDVSVGHLFDWYNTGDVEVRWPGKDMVSHVTPASAASLRDTIAGAGALVVGRRLLATPRVGAGVTRLAWPFSWSPTARPKAGLERTRRSRS